MMDLVHAMRTRIITSRAFHGNRILAAILFEATMDRMIEGRPTADYLWNVKQVVPILKVDKGLDAEANGVQLMKPMPALDALLDRAKANGIFGTKMRSVIKQANPDGIVRSWSSSSRSVRRSWPRASCRSSSPKSTSIAREKARQRKLLKAAILEPARRLTGHEERSCSSSPCPRWTTTTATCWGAPGVSCESPHYHGGYTRAEADAAPRPEPRCHRQLLSRTHRRTDRPDERRRVPRCPRRIHRRHPRGLLDLIPHLATRHGRW